MVTPTWLRGGAYTRRTKLTIDPSKVDAALTDFPVLVQLNGASGTGSRNMHQLFDDVGDAGGRFQLAFTADDGVTELHAEIEEWDHANKEAWIWVKVPSVSNTVDTDIYLYWGTRRIQQENFAFIHDHDSGGAELVWDANYRGVYHMRDKPALENLAAELSLGINQWTRVAVDAKGGYWYLIQSHTGDTRDGVPPLVRENSIYKYRISDGALVLSQTDVYDSGRTFSSGEVIDGKLFVTVRDFGTGTAWAHVVEYDLDTLTELVDHELGDGTVGDRPFEEDNSPNGYRVIEGIAKHDGLFWVMFGGAGGNECAIGQYTVLDNTGEVASFELFTNSAGNFGGQDIWWLGDDEVILLNHEPNTNRPWFERWKWTGTAFQQRAVYDYLNEGASWKISQGFTIYKGQIYMAGRYENKLYKVDLTLKAEDEGDGSGVADATLGRSNGTKTAAGEPNEVTVVGIPARAQDFGPSDELNVGQGAPLRAPLGAMSVECLLRADSFLTADEGKNTVFANQQGAIIQVRGDTNNEGKVAVHIRNVTTTGTYRFSHGADGVGNAALNAGQTYVIGFTWDRTDGANGTLRLFIDGVEHTAGDFPATNIIDANINYPNQGVDFHTIGAQNAASTISRFFDGKIGELRVSSIQRSDAWMIAGYHTIVDALMEYGGIEQVPISFPVSAY